MATLEKIRSKSVLLIIVIGVALLAFIVGDAITNGRNLFGEPTVIAKVDGEKIDISEYQRYYENLSHQAQNQGQKADEQMIAYQAMEGLITNKIYDEAVKNVGIQVPGALLREYMFSGQCEDIRPVINGLQGLNLKTPVQSIEQVYDIVFNPKKYGLAEAQVAPLQSAWVAAEAQAKKDLARQMYKVMVGGCIVANDLDKRALFDQENISSTTRLAVKPYGDLSAIDAKKYPVTDAEIKARYEQQKGLYRVDEPSKSINMIAVQVNPAAADINASKQLAQKTVKAMESGDAKAVDKLKTDGIVMQHYAVAADKLNPDLKEFVTTAAPNSVSIVKEGPTGFIVVRNGNHAQELASIEVNQVTTTTKLADKLLAQLNGGTSIDALPEQYKDSVHIQKNQKVELVGANGRNTQLSQTQLSNLLNSEGKYIVLDKRGDVSLLAQLVSKGEPVEVYEYDMVDYTLLPSANTIEAARAKLESYLAKNNDPAKFAANAAKAGYTSTPMVVGASTPGLGSGYSLLPNSRPAVRWAVQDGTKGEVSGVFDNGDSQNPWLYAVAIVDEFDGYAPYTDASVKKAIEQQLRAEKYGDALVKEFSAKGKTVDEIAEAMGVQARDLDVRLANPQEVGDAEVTGIIVMTKAGTPVKVVKGRNGVYAYEVTKVVDNKLTYDDNKYMQQYNGKHRPNVDAMVRSGKKVDNRLLKFYGGK